MQRAISLLLTCGLVLSITVARAEPITATLGFERNFMQRDLKAVTLKVTKHCELELTDCGFEYRQRYYIQTDVHGGGRSLVIRIMVARPAEGEEGPLVVADGVSEYDEETEARAFPMTPIALGTSVKAIIQFRSVELVPGTVDQWSVHFFYRARFVGKDGVFYNQFNTLSVVVTAESAPRILREFTIIGAYADLDKHAVPVRGEVTKADGLPFSEWLNGGLPPEEGIIVIQRNNKARIAIFDPAKR